MKGTQTLSKHPRWPRRPHKQTQFTEVTTLRPDRARNFSSILYKSDVIPDRFDHGLSFCHGSRQFFRRGDKFTKKGVLGRKLLRTRFCSSFDFWSRITDQQQTKTSYNFNRHYNQSKHFGLDATWPNWKHSLILNNQFLRPGLGPRSSSYLISILTSGVYTQILNIFSFEKRHHVLAPCLK